MGTQLCVINCIRLERERELYNKNLVNQTVYTNCQQPL